LSSNEAPQRPDTWVPIDQRVLGLDRRSFAPALVVLAFTFLFAVAMPALDRASSGDDPIVAGDVVDLAGGQIVFTPAVGWNLDAGLRYDPTRKEAVASTSSVSRDDVLVSIRTGPFDGSADELLDQINKENEDLKDDRGLGQAGERATVEVGEATGVAETFTGLAEKGLVVALVYEVDGSPVGAQVTVRGTPESIDRYQEEIEAMIESIRPQAPSGGGTGS
jgi:hypothetical protein